METLVSAHVDHQLSGISEWYTKNHIKGCAQCQASLPFLGSLKDRLATLDDSVEVQPLSDERLIQIEAEIKKQS